MKTTTKLFGSIVLAVLLVCSMNACNADADPEYYTVRFDSNGGTAVPAQQVAPGGKVTEPSDVTRDGYIFDGWYTDSTYTTKWNFANDTVNRDISLYAWWTSITTFSVYFQSFGGTDAPSQQVDEGGTVTEPTGITKPWHTLDGWYTDRFYTTKWNFASDVVTGFTQLFAKWNPIYAIGDRGPGGGTIIYYSEFVSEFRYGGFTMTDTNEICYYLEAASVPGIDWQWSLSTPWGTKVGGTDSKLGSGRANTARILAADPNAPAAKACVEYNGGGKTDWFLPSSNELLYYFINTDYLVRPCWTSTETEYGDSVWTIGNYEDSEISWDDKTKLQKCVVMAVRAF